MNRWDETIKEKARRCRENGYSLAEIAAELKVPKITLQWWVKDIKLTDKQRERLKRKEIECGTKALVKACKTNREKLEKWKLSVKKKADYFKGIFDKKSDFAKLICGVLYLCEGGKYPNSRGLTFGSADPKMIQTFLKLLRNNFNIDEKKFRCRIMHRCDQDGKSLNKFWSNLTKIPFSQFYRNYEDKRTKEKPTLKKDYKGVCAVQYLSLDVQYELQLIGETIHFLES